MLARGRVIHVMVLAAMIVAIGCGGGSGDSSSTEMDRDLTLPPAVETPPSLTDIPDTRPVTSQPVPRPAAPATKAPVAATPTPVKAVEPEVIPIPAPTATTGTVPAGTALLASLNSRVCTSAKVGDKFVATTTQELAGSNGVRIPAGATVTLEVHTAAAITDSTKGVLTFRVRTIESGGESYMVVATAEPVAELERTRTTETSSDVRKVAGGAVAGAVIGQILGRDTKSTVVGAAAGAAAGTAVALATGTFEGCAAEKKEIRVTLVDALVLPVR